MDDQPTAAKSNEEPGYDLQEDGDPNSKKALPQTMSEANPVPLRDGSCGTCAASSAAAVPRSRQPSDGPADLMRTIVDAFHGQVVHRRPSLRYRFAVVSATVGLCVLVAAYIAAAAGLACGLFLYGTYAVSTIRRSHESASFFDFLFHAAMLIGGLAVLYSLIAPLFRRRRHELRGMCLPTGAHPVLHGLVQAICRLITPEPAEIVLEPTVNAWASRRGGFLGLGSRLVLGIGGPLFLGMDIRSLAGVIGHELGHFSQSGSRTLLAFIVPVACWFEEATARTTGFNEAFAGAIGENSWWYNLFMFIMWLTTGLGRVILTGFVVLSRLITFNLSRQMEFDADQYQAQVAGSQSFLAAFERLAELQAGFDHVIVKMLSGQIAAMNILQLAERVVAEADNPSPEVRRRANKYLAPKTAHWFDSHPSTTERVATVLRQQYAGVFQLVASADCLLNKAALLDRTTATTMGDAP